MNLRKKLPLVRVAVDAAKLSGLRKQKAVPLIIPARIRRIRIREARKKASFDAKKKFVLPSSKLALPRFPSKKPFVGAGLLPREKPGVRGRLTPLEKERALSIEAELRAAHKRLNHKKRLEVLGFIANEKKRTAKR